MAIWLAMNNLMNGILLLSSGQANLVVTVPRLEDASTEATWVSNFVTKELL